MSRHVQLSKIFIILFMLSLTFSSTPPANAQTDTGGDPPTNLPAPVTEIIQPVDPALGGAVAGQASGIPLNPSVAGFDDRYNTDITGWYVYEHQNITDVMNTATNNNLRVVDLYVESTTYPYQFTTVYVSNTGSYAKSWWILVNVTPSNLLSFVTANNARITVLKAFNDPAPGGDVRYYAVMVSNTGADAKSWWFYHGQTVGGVSSLLQTNNARLVQVNSYVQNAQTLYDVVMISNTGADASSWWWYVNATPANIVNTLNANNARLIDMDIDPVTGNYNVIMVSCASGCPMWWWYYGISTSNLLNIAGQDGARIIDANTVPGCGDQCWSFILINNSNAITSRVGQMLRGGTDGTTGLFLKQVGGPVLANLMDGFVYEPASAIKAIVHLYTMRQIQAGNVALTTQITKYLPPPPGNSCPGNTANGTEAIQDADREMMWHSDNTRTRELADYFGVSSINLMAGAIGMTHTSINHIIGCGGPVPDQTTLDDLATLYEGVASTSLVDPARRDLFFSQAAGKAQFKAEGYDWTGLWSTDFPNLINQEAPAGMPAERRTWFLNQMDLAYKAGNYNLCTNLACSSLVYDIAISGWAQIPFCSASGVALRQFVFGTFISNATNLNNASNTFNATKAELLREQIHSGLASCSGGLAFLPALVK